MTLSHRYTYDNFGRELSGRELDYLMSQITVDNRQGHKLVARSVSQCRSSLFCVTMKITMLVNYESYYISILVLPLSMVSIIEPSVFFRY